LVSQRVDDIVSAWNSGLNVRHPARVNAPNDTALAVRYADVAAAADRRGLWLTFSSAWSIAVLFALGWMLDTSDPVTS
jgi:hypothetical protein